MIKAVKEAMALMSSTNVVSSVMYLYSATLYRMKEVILFSKAKGNCYVTSAQHYLQKCLQNKHFRL
jgi:hypothetical protein